MNVRLANKFDVNQVIQLIHKFQEANKLPESLMKELDDTYLNKLFYHLILGAGIVYVAEVDNNIVGMIIGMKSASPWFPNQITLKELMLYTIKEYEGKGIASNLLKAYNDHAKELLENKDITLYAVSITKDLGKLNYEKYGYKKIEETWAIGI
jgi:GNAT superfamily N-acetyltransferase